MQTWWWSTTVLALLAACFGHVASDSIDSGFTQDGATTYCQGINAGQSNLQFAELHASNAGRCPMSVKLTATPTGVHVNDAITITWKAELITSTIAGNIFPNAVASAQKTGVRTSFIKACAANTNCATFIDGAANDPADAGQGTFTDNKKTLRPYTFKFTTPGDYILVGIVEIDGDATLNISASDFIVFQKITVVAAGQAIPTTNATTTNNSTNATTTTTPVATTLPTTTTTAVAGTVSTPNASNSSEAGVVITDPTTTKTPSTSASTETSSGFFKQHTALLASAGGLCLVVLIVGYVSLMRKRTNKTTQYHKEMLRVYSQRRQSGGDRDGRDGPTTGYVQKRSTRNRQSPAENLNSSMAILGPPSSLNDEDVVELGSMDRGSEFDLSAVGKSSKRPLRSISEQNAPSVSSQAILYNPSEVSSTAVRTTTASEAIAESADDLEKDYFEPPSWHSSVMNGSESGQKMSCVSFDSDISVDDDNIKISSFASHDLSLIESEGLPSFASGPSSTARRFTGDSEFSMRSPRSYSEASIDSYAFRPSASTNADSRYSEFSMLSEDELMRSQGPSLGNSKGPRRK